MLRIGLLSTLVLALALGGAGVAPGAALAAGPDFSLSANPSNVSVGAGVGGPASSQVTVTPSGGFTGTVTFQVSGLPAGASASVVPNSSGASIVFSSVAAPFTSSTVTVTGTSGSLTHTVAIQLQVVPPVSDLAISASPSSVTVGAGSGVMVQSTIRLTTVSGFTGLPTFTANPLPAGVTAVFRDTSPQNGGFVSALLFSATSSAASGTSSVAVTGFEGNVSATTTITLTVTGGTPPRRRRRRRRRRPRRRRPPRA